MGKQFKLGIIVVLILFFVIGAIFIIPKDNDGVMVLRVIDGDTIVLSTGEIVRYIGMDTPEKGECYYEEAKKRNEELVLGKFVKLIKDISETDKYRRLLRYVYADGHLVNALLVEEGYAKTMAISPDVSRDWFFNWLESNAKIHNVGIWANCK